MRRSARAVAAFAEGFSCSQAVLVAFGVPLGLERDTALKLAQGLAGGMGHLGQACGAVTGALLAIGLRFGRTRPDDLAARDKTYAVVQDFAARFQARHGSIGCHGLLGVDLGTESGRREARDRDLFRTRCTEFVRSAGEILEELLPEG